MPSSATTSPTTAPVTRQAASRSRRLLTGLALLLAGQAVLASDWQYAGGRKGQVELSLTQAAADSADGDLRLLPLQGLLVLGGRATEIRSGQCSLLQGDADLVLACGPQAPALLRGTVYVRDDQRSSPLSAVLRCVRACRAGVPAHLRLSNL